MKVIFEKEWKLPRKGDTYDAKYWAARHRVYSDILLMKSCKYISEDGSIVTYFNEDGSIRTNRTDVSKDPDARE